MRTYSCGTDGVGWRWKWRREIFVIFRGQWPSLFINHGVNDCVLKVPMDEVGGFGVMFNMAKYMIPTVLLSSAILGGNTGHIQISDSWGS